ncbi:uncharacterized protein CMU_017680 [Cryptosporidium muris RN66]|uniref:Uncharacterized protein n=1 Tax=Cryptosporidium muris (strain RN66) TaxID=441375 RepID=B6AD10_CRYMR|nr:uncharacterized protein CMU_017680 [Cryptosporidium muris RN66]EEA06014.1 hypothetical protein CMU_017680 [Cryptosporidium muris RN66]|eukprot:XP_002140363.1 hypothetical protein [Cryptosporidium muris RN66]
MKEYFEISNENSKLSRAYRTWISILKNWKYRIGATSATKFRFTSCNKPKICSASEDATEILVISPVVTNNPLKSINSHSQDSEQPSRNLFSCLYNALRPLNIFDNKKSDRTCNESDLTRSATFKCPTIPRRMLRLLRRKRKYNKGSSKVKLITVSNFYENIEGARRMSDERLQRAYKFYEHMLQKVQQSAYSDIISFLVENFEDRDILILTKYISSSAHTKSIENETLDKLYNIAFSTNENQQKSLSTLSILNDNTTTDCHSPYHTLTSELLDENIDDGYCIFKKYNDYFDESDKVSATLLVLANTTYDNVEAAASNLVARVSFTSLELSDTIKDCIKKGIIDATSGKYKGAGSLK